MSKAKQIIFPQTSSEEIIDFYKKIADAIRKKYFDKYHANDDAPERRRLRIYDRCALIAMILSIPFAIWLVIDIINTVFYHYCPDQVLISMQFVNEHSWSGFLFPQVTICCTVILLLFIIFTAINYHKYDKIVDAYGDEQDKIVTEIKQLFDDNNVLNCRPNEYWTSRYLLSKKADPFNREDLCWMYKYLKKLESIKTDAGQYTVTNDGHDLYVSLCINGFQYQTQKLANFDLDEFTAITARADESVYGIDQGIYDFTIIDKAIADWMEKINKNIIGG